MTTGTQNSLIQRIKTGLRKEAGIPSYDPNGLRLVKLPTLKEALSELDPSPGYLRCQKCHSALVSGVNSHVCIYCGMRPTSVGPAPTLSFNSTVACRRFLESLQLDGSEVVLLEPEDLESASGRNAHKKETLLSDFLDVKLKLPKETQELSSTSSKVSCSYAQMADVDLDDFFSEVRRQLAEAITRERLVVGSSVDSPSISTLPDDDSFSVLERRNAPSASVQDNEGSSVKIVESFSSWEASFGSANTGDRIVTSDGRDPFSATAASGSLSSNEASAESGSDNYKIKGGSQLAQDSMPNNTTQNNLLTAKDTAHLNSVPNDDSHYDWEGFATSKINLDVVLENDNAFKTSVQDPFSVSSNVYLFGSNEMAGETGQDIESKKLHEFDCAPSSGKMSQEDLFFDRDTSKSELSGLDGSSNANEDSLDVWKDFSAPRGHSNAPLSNSLDVNTVVHDDPFSTSWASSFFDHNGRSAYEVGKENLLDSGTPSSSMSHNDLFSGGVTRESIRDELDGPLNEWHGFVTSRSTSMNNRNAFGISLGDPTTNNKTEQNNETKEDIQLEYVPSPSGMSAHVLFAGGDLLEKSNEMDGPVDVWQDLTTSIGTQHASVNSEDASGMSLSKPFSAVSTGELLMVNEFVSGTTHANVIKDSLLFVPFGPSGSTYENNLIAGQDASGANNNEVGDSFDDWQDFTTSRGTADDLLNQGHAVDISVHDTKSSLKIFSTSRLAPVTEDMSNNNENKGGHHSDSIPSTIGKFQNALLLGEDMKETNRVEADDSVDNWLDFATSSYSPDTSASKNHAFNVSTHDPFSASLRGNLFTSNEAITESRHHNVVNEEGHQLNSVPSSSDIFQNDLVASRDRIDTNTRDIGHSLDGWQDLATFRDASDTVLNKEHVVSTSVGGAFSTADTSGLFSSKALTSNSGGCNTSTKENHHSCSAPSSSSMSESNLFSWGYVSDLNGDKSTVEFDDWGDFATSNTPTTMEENKETQVGVDVAMFGENQGQLVITDPKVGDENFAWEPEFKSAEPEKESADVNSSGSVSADVFYFVGTSLPMGSNKDLLNINTTNRIETSMHANELLSLRGYASRDIAVTGNKAETFTSEVLEADYDANEMFSSWEADFKWAEPVKPISATDEAISFTVSSTTADAFNTVEATLMMEPDNENQLKVHMESELEEPASVDDFTFLRETIPQHGPSFSSNTNPSIISDKEKDYGYADDMFSSWEPEFTSADPSRFVVNSNEPVPSATGSANTSFSAVEAANPTEADLIKKLNENGSAASLFSSKTVSQSNSLFYENPDLPVGKCETAGNEEEDDDDDWQDFTGSKAAPDLSFASWSQDGGVFPDAKVERSVLPYATDEAHKRSSTDFFDSWTQSAAGTSGNKDEQSNLAHLPDKAHKRSSSDFFEMDPFWTVPITRKASLDINGMLLQSSPIDRKLAAGTSISKSEDHLLFNDIIDSKTGQGVSGHPASKYLSQKSFPDGAHDSSSKPKNKLNHTGAPATSHFFPVHAIRKELPEDLFSDISSSPSPGNVEKSRVID